MNAGAGPGRVLVTGAGGLIGHAVVRALLAQGVAVRAHLGPPGAPVRPAPPAAEAVRAAIDDPAAVADLVAGTQAVLHLAGPPSVAESFRDPAAHARAHCLGTANILAACRAHRVRRLVHVSSAEIYGQPARNPVAEDAPPQPRSPYAAMKLAAEHLIATCPRDGAMQAVILRPFSVIGPPVAPHSVLGTIIRQALGPDEVAVQAPEIVRDYVAAADVAEAIVAAWQAPLAGETEIFNIGSGTGTSVRALGHLVLGLLGRPPVVRTAAQHDRGRAADIVELVADPARIAAGLGWRPRTALSDALRAVIDAARVAA